MLLPQVVHLRLESTPSINKTDRKVANKILQAGTAATESCWPFSPSMPFWLSMTGVWQNSMPKNAGTSWKFLKTGTASLQPSLPARGRRYERRHVTVTT